MKCLDGWFRYVNLLVISPTSQEMSGHTLLLLFLLTCSSALWNNFLFLSPSCYSELLAYSVGVWLEGIISVIIEHHIKLLIKWNGKKSRAINVCFILLSSLLLNSLALLELN